MGIGTKLRKKNTQKQTTKKKEKKIQQRSVRHVLDLRVHLVRINLLISGGKPTDTPFNILDWYKMGIARSFEKIFKKEITKKKKKNKTKRQVPRYRISMLYPLSCGELAMHGKKI